MDMQGCNKAGGGGRTLVLEYMQNTHFVNFKHWIEPLLKHLAHLVCQRNATTIKDFIKPKYNHNSTRVNVSNALVDGSAALKTSYHVKLHK